MEVDHVVGLHLRRAPRREVAEIFEHLRVRSCAVIAASSPTVETYSIDLTMKDTLGGLSSKLSPGKRPNHARLRHGRADVAPLFEPREGLPAGGRDECRHGERPCPYVFCEHHLWRLDGVDRRGSINHRDAKTPAPATLLPRWLEYPTPACCELDFTEQTPFEEPRDVTLRIRGSIGLRISPARSTRELAAAFGMTPQRLNQLVREILDKLSEKRDAREIFEEMIREAR